LANGGVIYGQQDQSATLTSSASLWTANNFAVTGYLALGADPADAGAIRLPNAGYIYSEADAAGTDISVNGVDSSEVIQIGDTGASGVTITPNLFVTGTIQGRAKFVSLDESTTLTAATHNGALVRLTVAGEITLWDCETANVGDFVTLWARDAEKIEVVPASGDQFYLFDGTGIGANDELDMAATAGTKVTLMCTADDSWSVITETAACADGGAAD
jgi:hypothetical protein